MSIPDPPTPPFNPDHTPDQPKLNVPLPPPLVGEGSPWQPANAENRDRILNWWRAWFREIFFPWIKAWTAWWFAQWQRLAAYLNAWIAWAEAYIRAHAVNGHSWWSTTTPIAASGTTTVTIIPHDPYRPILIGDLVSDHSADIRYGQVVEVVDDTHAVVTPLGTLKGERGPAGRGWWQSTGTIGAGSSTVTIVPVSGVTPQVGDFVIDGSGISSYGRVTAVVNSTTVTVTYGGTLRGHGWWRTDDALTDGTTSVTLDPVVGGAPQVGDFVVDGSPRRAYGQIVSVESDTSVTVEFVGVLRGPAGIADLGSFTVNTGTLAPNGDPGDTYQAQMEPFPQMVGAFVLTVSSRCWVRVYASEAYMLADAGRSIFTPLNIQDDHGCFLDFVGVPSELSKTLTPGIQFADIGYGLWVSVVNTDLNDPADVAVNFDFRTFLE